ncbi:Fc.00g097900.m01.CDS01 [Cosmosporella sp. VM-42]
MPTIPKGLQPGETIAFISPSFRVNEIFPLYVERGKAVLEAKGYPVKVFWTHEDAKTTTIAQHVANRKREILEAFADPEVRAICCTVGGTTADELIRPFLYDASAVDIIRKNPKIFFGYSDITILHWIIYHLSGLRTFYGPGVYAELGEAPSPMAFTLDNLLRAIAYDASTGALPKPIGPVPRSRDYAPLLPDDGLDSRANVTPNKVLPTPAWRWVRGGACTGRIFGGCLAIVGRLHGVRTLEPDWTGRVLFLETATADDETKGLPIYRIRQFIADLIAYGVMDQISGLIFGRFYGYDSQESQDELAGVIHGLLCEGEIVKNNKEFPILMNVDVGHTSPMITIPMDALVRLDSAKDEFSILEAGIQ